MQKRILTAFVLLAATLTLPVMASAAKKAPAVAANATGAPSIKIGFINSITGPEAPIGENLTNGAMLAVEDLKKKGINIELVKEDDGGDAKKALLAFEKLTTSDNVSGIVGPYTSSSAAAVVSSVDASKTPLILPAAAKEDLTRKGYKYVFRMNAPASVYSAALMDGIATLDRPKTIAFIAAKTDFGTSTVATAKSYAWSSGLRFVGEEYYQKGQPDFRAILSKIKAAKPDLVFMVSYEADAILLMRQARELKLTPKAFLGAGAGFTTTQFLNQPEISRGVFAATQWTGDVKWKGAGAFESAYVAKYGKQPTYHAACAYESVRIMGEAAAEAEGNRDKTRSAILFHKWDGIMGEVKFADYKGYTNQNNHAMLVQQAQGSKYITVFPKKTATGAPLYPFKWTPGAKDSVWSKFW